MMKLAKSDEPPWLMKGRGKTRQRDEPGHAAYDDETPAARSWTWTQDHTNELTSLFARAAVHEAAHGEQEQQQHAGRALPEGRSLLRWPRR